MAGGSASGEKAARGITDLRQSVGFEPTTLGFETDALPIELRSNSYQRHRIHFIPAREKSSMVFFSALYPTELHHLFSGDWIRTSDFRLTKRSNHTLRYWLNWGQGVDLHHRPFGHEPNKLLLLHPAMEQVRKTIVGRMGGRPVARRSPSLAQGT